MNFSYSSTIEDELTFDVELELTCTEQGEGPTMPSMNYPGDPGHGPEFELDGDIEVNGVALEEKTFVKLFGQDALDQLVETAETQAANSGEFG